MKLKLIYLLTALTLSIDLYAQLPSSIVLVKGSTLHFRSPEPIRYVDLSSPDLKGDLPLDQLLRVKLKLDSGKTKYDESPYLITIAGESFLAQYRIIALDHHSMQPLTTEIEIQPKDMLPLSPASPELTTPQIKACALELLSQHKSRKLFSARGQDISLHINRIASAGDLIFIDITASNASHMAYEIDNLEFSLQDRRIVKATNQQSIELKPRWQLYPSKRFTQHYRNIYVLNKLSLSGEKCLKITLTEVQPSVRKVSIFLKSRDLLNADTF
ncbi:DUF4138 domain-containing protein [Pedobacter rhizosphaerae]|uniref:Bacteroides conjugative transposon TraN protein n=1 Tax=Pedobacter rhizosphaerae TaxID=390241 RepID=A0A1H9N5Z4_9SPHI|nr:DUF4138 domain-containing protein [Pedobacter rhizosphaerae]SER31075.1 protein of unknown function [Pedobacter rhizosphaerae]